MKLPYDRLLGSQIIAAIYVPIIDPEPLLESSSIIVYTRCHVFTLEVRLVEILTFYAFKNKTPVSHPTGYFNS